jgi:ABC-type antimicrobial peptide transport system permease subunit
MVPMLFRTAQVLIRTDAAPLSVLPAVRATLREIDRQVLVVSAATVRDRVADSVAEPRFYAGLVLAFALLSLALAAVGIYGMLAYVVQQGTRDTAIRRALGAPVGQILGAVLREGMALAVAGLAIGIVGAYFLTRTMASMLYEIESTDPRSFAVVSVVFLGVALAAVWIPARRASRVDPMEVLRYQ